MTIVRRFDRGELRAAHKTKEGYLYAEGYATRAGVFLYKDREGSIRRELRPPSEVGDPESLASLARKPITNLHPTSFVDADNTATHGAGLVDPEVLFERDYADGFVKVKMTISRSDAVKDIEGGRRELSCGYTAELDETPGTWTDHSGTEHRYDSIQRKIRYNHLALVDKGRAGAHARLRVDSSDAVRIDQPETPNVENHTMSEPQKNNATLMISGQPFRLDEYPAIQREVLSLEKRNDGLAEELAELAKKVAEYEVKMADMEKELADMKAESDPAADMEGEEDMKGEEEEDMKGEEEEDMKGEEDKDRIDWANERYALIAWADDLRLDGFEDPRNLDMSNAEIKRAIVGSRFDEDTLKTKFHVDAALELMLKERSSESRNDADPVDETDPDKGSTKLVNALFNGRPTRREDRADTNTLAAAQAGYEERMRANLQ